MTSNPALWDSAAAWRRFRLEAKAAEHYPLSYAMYADQTHRDALLETLIPALLYIKAVAILDDSFELWLDRNGHRLSPPYRDDLNGRLKFFGDRALLAHVDQLHDVRKRRNGLAHEPATSCTWQELDRDANIIEGCLVSLGLARATRNLQYFSECSALIGSEEPGVSFCRTYTYGVKEDGHPSLEISWTQKFLEDEATREEPT